MYILNWNPSEQLLEASFGGAVTRGEADVFIDELKDFFRTSDLGEFCIVIDFAKVSRLDDNVAEAFNFARELAQFSGASNVTFVTRNDDEVSELVNGRLQQVLEGTERYVAYRLAA